MFGLYGLIMALTVLALDAIWLYVGQRSTPGTWIFWETLDRPILILQLQIVFWTLAVLPGIFYAATFFRKKAFISQALEFILLAVAIGFTFGVVFRLGQFGLTNLSSIASGAWWRAAGPDFLLFEMTSTLTDIVQIVIWVSVGALVSYIFTYAGLIRWDQNTLKNTGAIMLILTAAIALIPPALALLTL